MHVPGEGGLKGHDPLSLDFKCLFQCYLSINIFQVFYIEKPHLTLFQGKRNRNEWGKKKNQITSD